MPKTAPRNLRRGIGRISGGIVDKLNRLGKESGIEGHENLGTELAREINRHLIKINVRQDAQSGFGGPVVVAPQGRKSSSGPTPQGLMVSGGRVGDVAPAIDNTDVPNWQQVRGLFTCENFGGHVSGFQGWFEDCVDDRTKKAAATPVTPGDTSGIVHAMWGYTYDIPSFSDTVATADCGQLEFGVGFFWQQIVPARTQLDQVSWRRASNTLTGTVSGLSQLRFALYDLNQANDSYPRVAVTDPQDLTLTGANTTYILPLTERVTIDPGLYAVAMTAPCFHTMYGIKDNLAPWLIAHDTYQTILPTLGPSPRFGAFYTTDGSMPAALDSSNIVTDGSFDASSIQHVPMSYWSDSQEFAA